MQEEPLRVLAFDIGIRNLAWCFLDQTKPTPTIRGWENYDLLLGDSVGSSAAAKKVSCSSCSVAARFTNGSGAAVSSPTNGAAVSSPTNATTASTPTCLRHCPDTHPPLRDLSGGQPFKQIPPLPTLRTLVESLGIPTKRATRATLLQTLSGRFSLPLEKVKLKKAIETDLIRIHDSIRTFVGSHYELFRQATHILLENQPVLKNPTMKSVQILLFATLRDILQPNPPSLHLVHAGKKITGMATGDAGYASRKDAAEAKVISLLDGGKIVESAKWKTFFTAQAKKSDLADALCMVWDLHEKRSAAPPVASVASVASAPSAKAEAKVAL
jgi:hypothetical protein